MSSLTTFTVGQALTAALMNGVSIRTVVAGTAAERAAYATPFSGMTWWETDTFRKYVYDGTGWIVMAELTQSYTPTVGGFTLGNGTILGTYHRSDGWCDFEVRIGLGSTSAVTGALTVTLPITAAAVAVTNGFHAGFIRFGIQEYSAMVASGSTTGVNLRAVDASGTYAASAATSATIPFTWNVNDGAYVRGRYQMTTRYS